MKNLTLKTLSFLSLFSSTALAGPKDLKTFNFLLDIGVTAEYFMSQTHLGLDNINCSYSPRTQDFHCDMIDISGNEGQGSDLSLTGPNARSMYQLLRENGLQGHASSLRCRQSSADVSDGTEAERTSCEFSHN